MGETKGDRSSRSSGKKTKKSDKFEALLNKWKETDDGSKPFEVAKPRNKSVGSAQKSENEKAIKKYKRKVKKKGFKERKATRGMSQLSKPAQLQNIIGEQTDDDTSLEMYKAPVFKKTPTCNELIRKAIDSNFFFDELSDSDLPVFVDAFEPIEVEQGSKVITQGVLGDYFYVIGSGTVTFQVDGNKVGTGEPSGSFGELALLYSCPRAATVIADSSPTKLYRVGQKTFRSLLQKQSQSKEAEKMKLLKSVDFLSQIGESDLKRLGQNMTLHYFEDGDYLVHKGDEGDAFYIVYEGSVECRDISVGETKFDNLTLKAGSYFGERSLATNEPRAANVVATSKGSTFQIDRKTFEKVLGKFSRVIMKSQDRRVLEGVDILSGLQPKQFEELANLVVDKKFREGDVIFDQLKRTKAALYLVREGTVQLTGSRNITIKPGAYFGDDLLLLDTKQDVKTDKRASTKTLPVFTAVASEKCLCGVLSLSDCRTIFDTTKLIEPDPLLTTIETTPLSSQQKDDDEESEDEELAEIEALGRMDGVKRETTKQWLKRSSKDGLRRAVRSKIKLDQLERHNVLGEGQFGEVWFVSTVLDGEYGQQHFALKSQMIEDPTRGNSVSAIRREIEVLGIMDHPYIVGYIHHYEDPERMHILMSLVHGGELFDVIHTENEDGTWSSGIPEKDSAFYGMVIADTLDYMHRKQFVYRDLKPENVLIDKDGYPILVDFGFAKRIEDKTYTLCGTPNYLSPEVIMNRGHNAATDHWALGVLIYEMVAGENPFYYDGMPQMELFSCIVREKFYPLPDEVSDECFYVVDELLEKDPNQRLGSLAGRGKDIINKKWFDFFTLDNLRQKKYTAPFIPCNTTLEEEIERTSTQSSLDDSCSSIHSIDSSVASSNGARSPKARTKLFGSASSNSSSLLDD
mmetsp:Transcript_52013/g.125490  ORF Transcript_52013/g.125490 Transcript_52013/m.125490 type:complete len:914 (+) Transcript_52013:468-3209(+)